MALIKKGMTRNLFLRNIGGPVTEARLREDFGSITNLVVVEFKMGTCQDNAVVSLNSIYQAMHARICLGRNKAYEAIKITCAVDKRGMWYLWRRRVMVERMAKARNENHPATHGGNVAAAR